MLGLDYSAGRPSAAEVKRGPELLAWCEVVVAVGPGERNGGGGP